ncbi:MAG TPA: TetR family transcriptional regulator [Solirubrobacterales bacterium]|nr:TetR family transcriptional regulator [Solirubrobacterales bacterium]
MTRGVEASVDGRLARGQRRRAELIEATLTVIERDGVGGVSHRAVARVAGVSPSAALHHFATIDDLLVAAVISANEESLQVIATVEDIAGLADLLAHQIVLHRTRFVALFELYLLAARRPALRPEAYRWIAAAEAAAIRLGADRIGARALAAALDGLGLQALLGETVPDRGETAAILSRTIS